MMPDLKDEYDEALYRLEKQQILLMSKPGWFPGSRLWRKIRYFARLSAALSLQKKLIEKKPEPEDEGQTGFAFRVAGITSFIWFPVLNKLDEIGTEAGGVRFWFQVMKVAIFYALVLLAIFARVLFLESGSIL
jgi:hypothetical protein